MDPGMGGAYRSSKTDVPRRLEAKGQGLSVS